MTEAKQKERKRRLPPVFTAAEDYTQPVEATHEEIDDFGDVEETEAAPEVEAVEEIAPAPVEVAAKTEPVPNGWNLLTEKQHDGKHYLVTHNVEEPPTRAFWRKTRVLSHNRWVLNGKWSNSLTRADLLNEPVYYREI